MYFQRVPIAARLLFPHAVWTSKNEIRLKISFDDGPYPNSTPRLLSLLKNKKVKASFFCLGSQAEKHPELISAILNDGHLIGHHGYDHISGWQSTKESYLTNAFRSEDFLVSSIYRPPYGKITPSQERKLRQEYGWTTVFWSHMPGDFDRKVDKETLLSRIQKIPQVHPIIVLHDRPETIDKLEYVLNAYL